MLMIQRNHCRAFFNCSAWINVFCCFFPSKTCLVSWYTSIYCSNPEHFQEQYYKINHNKNNKTVKSKFTRDLHNCYLSTCTVSEISQKNLKCILAEGLQYCIMYIHRMAIVGSSQNGVSCWASWPLFPPFPFPLLLEQLADVLWRGHTHALQSSPLL